MNSDNVVQQVFSILIPFPMNKTSFIATPFLLLMRTVLGSPVRRMSALATLPRWNAAAYLATVLYERARLPIASVSSE